MEEVPIIDNDEGDNKLSNDKNNSEVYKMLCSLTDNIKALAECKAKPKTIKYKLEDERFVFDKKHNLKQTYISRPMPVELEDEILIIDEIKPKQLPNNNVFRESDNIKIQPEDKNKDGEDCNKQSKEPSTVLEIDLDDYTVITNDGRTEPVLEVVAADPQVKQENDCTNYLKEVLNPMDKLSDPMSTADEENSENKIQFLKCEECYFTTKTKLNMEIHNENVHKNEAIFSCHICDYKSLSRSDVVNHNSQTHHINCIQCNEGEVHEQCNFEDNEDNSTKKACKPITKKYKILICHICDYTSLSRNDVVQHNSQIHHINCIQCNKGEVHEQCNFNDIEDNSTKKACKPITKKYRIQNKCNEQCNFKDNSTNKACKLITKKSRIFACHICDYTSLSRHYIMKHFSQIHHINCIQCNKSEVHGQCNFNNIEDNSTKKACKPITKNYKIQNKCVQCDFKATLKGILNLHVRAVHRKEVRYSCDGCEYKSFLKSSVTNHQNQVHNDTKQRVIGIGCLMCEEGELHVKCQFTTNISSLNESKGTEHLGETRYNCDICGIKSFDRQNIRQHMEDRHKYSNARVKSINCAKCQNNVEHEICLANQKNKNNQNVAQGTHQLCTSCNYVTIKAAYFKKHQQLNHEPESDISKVITCNQCEFQTLNPKSMKYHKRAQHLGETRYFCDICGLKSFYEHYISHHIVSKHNGTNASVKKVNCTQCQSNVEHKSHDKVNKNKTTIQSNYECKQCNYFSSTKQALRLHAKKIHDDGNKVKHGRPMKRLDCTFCPFVFVKSLNQMIKHIKTDHPNKKLLQCDSCNYKCNRNQNLKAHKTARHNVKLLNCDQCEYKTKWSTALSQHMRGNHGIFKYKSKYREDLEIKEILCDICGFSATNKRSMSLHIESKCISKSNTHKYEENNMTEFKICYLCGIKANNMRSLLIHMKEKHQPTDLVCNICDYRATGSRQLNIHTKSVHLGIEYPCTLCDYKGPSKNNLYKHIMGLHKEDDMKCNDCTFVADNYRQLNDHRKITHNNEQNIAIKIVPLSKQI